MKVILKPTITVVAHTVFDTTTRFDIPDDGSDACKLGSFAAKVCYDSAGKEGRSNIDNQKAILEHRHGSVAEHASVSLFIEGITRALTLELNRHRTFAISQRSTRYTKEEDSAIVLEPFYASIFEKYGVYIDNHDILAKNFDIEAYYKAAFDSLSKNIPSEEYPHDLELVVEHISTAAEAISEYKWEVERLIELNPSNLSGFDLRKWARGKARNILPHSLETRGTWTNNHRGWRWVIESRSDIHAESEIRRLVAEILPVLKNIAPEYYDDFEIVDTKDGIPHWKPKYSKI